MAISFIANSTGSASSTVTTNTQLVVNPTSSIPAGSTIVVALAMDTTTLITSITDDGGSVYTARYRQGSALDLWSTDADASLGTVTAVTINYTTGAKAAAAIAAYSGVSSIVRMLLESCVVNDRVAGLAVPVALLNMPS